MLNNGRAEELSFVINAAKFDLHGVIRDKCGSLAVNAGELLYMLKSNI